MYMGGSLPQLITIFPTINMFNKIHLSKMIPKYKQVVKSFFMSNDELKKETKNYNIIAMSNTKEGLVYVMKRKNLLTVFINKLFNK